MSGIKSFVKQNPVMCVALLAAAATACFVPPDSFFVMGDNRTEARDSRLKEIGTVPADRILGKVLFLN